MGETRLGQGRDNAKKFLAENPDLAEQLEAEIRANAHKLLSRQALAAARAAGRVPPESESAENAESAEAVETTAPAESAAPAKETAPVRKPRKAITVDADDYEE